MVPVNLCLFIIDNRKVGNLLCKVMGGLRAGEGALLLSQRLRVLIIEKLKCKLTKAAKYSSRAHRELFKVLFFKCIYKIFNMTNMFCIFSVFLS